MKKKYSVIIVVFVSIFYGLYSYADSDFLGFLSGEKGGVARISNATYNQECGSCHFAYQPGLLPTRSWQKMMLDEQLKNHFGEFIEYDVQTKNAILNYMVDNAADKSSYRRSQKFNNSISQAKTPLRITQTSYFKRKHYEIPQRFVTQPEVGSFSNCTACHKNADSGNYDEDSVNIPNVRRWED